MKHTLLLIVTLLGLILAPGMANAGDVEVSNAWAPKPLKGAMAAAVYFTLTNNGSEADSLVKASAPVAGSAELHSMKMDGDIMRMRQIEALPIPVGESVTLKPGGMHIMLMELKDFPVDGDSFPLTLTFAVSGEKHVDIIIKK